MSERDLAVIDVYARRIGAALARTIDEARGARIDVLLQGPWLDDDYEGDGEDHAVA